MKKLFISLAMIILFAGAAAAQTMTPHKEKEKTTAATTKTKPVATVPQKMHNALHPNHKKYSGMKTKQKTSK